MEQESANELLSNEQTLLAVQVMGRMFLDAKTTLQADSKFHFLLAVILSAQATDRAVNLATPALFAQYPRPQDLARAVPAEVQKFIQNLGLSARKAQYLVGCAQKLVSDFGGEVPADQAQLESLPGVGRKTADVVLAECFGQPRIAVDTHVSRVARRLQIVPAKASVVQIEKILMSKLPQNYWIRAHHLLIFWGRYQCLARKPKCDHCPLLKVCQYGRSHLL
ncbi:endonuclease III, partial [Ligilactobacillus salitolerans]|uniref:endonuclease III n=1 Tax=Ligilactobacillus salitolerans TaxID=1808352 RepID=UPI000F60A8CA